MQNPWWVPRLFLLLAATGCGHTPQMGADPNTFKAVDAFYTAISMREQALVERSAQAISQLKSEGKLPDQVSKALGEIEAMARADKWEAAQTQLSAFMRDQRPR